MRHAVLKCQESCSSEISSIDAVRMHVSSNRLTPSFDSMLARMVEYMAGEGANARQRRNIEYQAAAARLKLTPFRATQAVLKKLTSNSSCISCSVTDLVSIA